MGIKYNWGDLYHDYLLNYEPNGVNPTTYAKDNNLPPAQVRRAFNRLKKSGDNLKAGDHQPNGDFKPGNQISVKHGGYVSLTNIEPEFIEAVASMGNGDGDAVLFLARARILKFEQFINTAEADIRLQYAEGEPPTDGDGNIIL